MVRLQAERGGKVRQFVLIDVAIASATLRSHRPRPISDTTEVGANRPTRGGCRASARQRLDGTDSCRRPGCFLTRPRRSDVRRQPHASSGIAALLRHFRQNRQAIFSIRRMVRRPPEDFVHAVYANRIPIVGVCFGHEPLSDERYVAVTALQGAAARISHSLRSGSLRPYISSPKGSSTECAGWVNQRAPVSVMTM